MDFEKMGVSQNYRRKLGDGNLTSTPFKDWVKIGVLERRPPANP
jgi:hypothetical protein